ADRRRQPDQPRAARALRRGRRRARAPARPRHLAGGDRGTVARTPRGGGVSSPVLPGVLRRPGAGGTLSGDEAAEAFDAVMRGEGTPSQMAALLMGLRVRGERSSEVAGAARALRNAMTRLVAPQPEELVDTCGTGGGTITTFNISTAA